ncbi:MAG: ATP-dependent helicase [Candidatus Obscuribacterales bacterium]
MNGTYSPTEEQQAVIKHPHSAYISACPGAGKTRTMVERARLIMNQSGDRRGVAFLSFTNAAVTELETRLRAFGALPNPLFPSFIGTFDRFLWQFIISPFGHTTSIRAPRLVPDKNEWEVKPFTNARPLTLGDFDRSTGKFDTSKPKASAFDLGNKTGAYETAALNKIKNSIADGLFDFEDMRAIVKERLGQATFADTLGRALSARFSEIIVDEAQDCNPSDLEIVRWLLNSEIAVKLICDPNQSIYKFRGGVTEELTKFAEQFDKGNHLAMSGNFRSSPNICSAIVALRAPSSSIKPDRAIGMNENVSTPIHIISYSGKSVPQKIGITFKSIIDQLGISVRDAPILASTKLSAYKAAGRPFHSPTKDSTLLLAEVVTRYHYSFLDGKRREALIELHKVVLKIRGKIESLANYHVFMQQEENLNAAWRPEIISIANELQCRDGETADLWLARAREVLARDLDKSLSINSRLRRNSELALRLVKPDPTSTSARTIHSVKGLEFPAVCVVITTSTAGGILKVLNGQPADDMEEDARKLYVGASRAEKLLTIAIPRTQTPGFQTLLENNGCEVTVWHI